MNVRELIAELQKVVDKEAPIRFLDDEGYDNELSGVNDLSDDDEYWYVHIL